MSVHLFRVGKVWHMRFQVDGKRVQRSTRETAMHRAQPIAEAAYRHARLWARGNAAIPTLRELVAQWIETHKPTASRAHIKVADAFLRLYLYGLADVQVDELTTALVEDARNEHLKTHAPASTNQWLRMLKLFINWAVRRKVIPAVPFTIKLLKVQKRVRAILPVSLGQQWLDAIDRHEGDRQGVRTAVRLCLGLGLRESEAITARHEWVDWERQTYTPGITKGKESDPLPIPDWLADYLRPMRQPCGLIVFNPNGKPFASGFMRTAMMAANAEVGVGHITPHRLRGSYASLLSEAGVPIQSVQRALRHKSAMTTMAYLESDLDHIARGQRRIADRFGFESATNVSGNPVANDEAQTHAE